MSTLYATLHWLLIPQCLLLAAVVAWRRGPWPLPALLVCLAAQTLWDMASVAGASPRLDPTPLLAFSYGPLILALTRRAAWRDGRALPLYHLATPLIVFALASLWPQARPVLYPAIPVALAAYLVAAILETRRFDRVLRATRSTFESRNLRWLALLLGGFLIVGAVDAARQVAGVLDASIEPVLGVVTYGAALLMVYLLIWRVLVRPNEFDGLGEAERAAAGDAERDAADAEAETAERLRDRLAALEAFMESDRPHLSHDLTLARLAEGLGWSPRRLSTVLNRAAGRNFNDYVNGWRVREARRIMADPDLAGSKLIAIQLDAGFATKSVFNAAFRRETGLAPGPYRQRASGIRPPA